MPDLYKDHLLPIHISRLLRKLSLGPSGTGMARNLAARTLAQASSSAAAFLSRTSPCARLLAYRGRSYRSGKAQLIEINLSDDPEVEVLGARRLEDAIHGIIARRSAPDWLPFIPGSSYWVPPRQLPLGVVEVLDRLANPITAEEALSLTNVRGWPSFSYFVHEKDPHPMKKGKSKKKTSKSEEEEG